MGPARSPQPAAQSLVLGVASHLWSPGWPAAASWMHTCTGALTPLWALAVVRPGSWPRWALLLLGGAPGLCDGWGEPHQWLDLEDPGEIMWLPPPSGDACLAGASSLAKSTPSSLRLPRVSPNRMLMLQLSWNVGSHSDPMRFMSTWNLRTRPCLEIGSLQKSRAKVRSCWIRVWVQDPVTL